MQVIILDAKNLTYRFGHAHKYLSSSEGTATGVLYGITDLLLRLKKHFSSARFVAVWDGDKVKQLGWRHKVFSNYKNNRIPGNEEDRKAREAILNQIPLMQEMFINLGIPQIQIAGMEADDIISILSLLLVEHKQEPIIMSSDKDFAQLLHRGVKLIRDIDKSVKFKFESEEDTEKHFKCQPEFVLKIRAYLGDSSDAINSPFKGVGPVGANQYLSAGADPSVENFESLPHEVRLNAVKLEENWPHLHRNYQLMKLMESVTDERLTAQQSTQLKQSIKMAVSQLKRPQRADYDALLKFLRGYDLNEAVAKRNELLRIQEIS